MSTLYVTRHGQTLFNKLRRKQGWCDSPLTAEGIEQARHAGEWFRAHGIEFDHVYSSTSERACDTTELICPGAPYERLKGLKEFNYGYFEAQPEELSIHAPYGDYYVPFEGESGDAFARRLQETLLDIMNRPAHESVLAVSHGAAIAQMLRNNGFEWHGAGLRMGNCAVCIFDFNREAQTLTFRELVNTDEWRG